MPRKNPKTQDSGKQAAILSSQRGTRAVPSQSLSAGLRQSSARVAHPRTRARTCAHPHAHTHTRTRTRTPAHTRAHPLLTDSLLLAIIEAEPMRSFSGVDSRGEERTARIIPHVCVPRAGKLELGRRGLLGILHQAMRIFGGFRKLVAPLKPGFNDPGLSVRFSVLYDEKP